LAKKSGLKDNINNANIIRQLDEDLSTLLNTIDLDLKDLADTIHILSQFVYHLQM
jgi:hypothetical protein